jgi:hypothetical protein
MQPLCDLQSRWFPISNRLAPPLPSASLHWQNVTVSHSASPILVALIHWILDIPAVQLNGQPVAPEVLIGVPLLPYE